jgi:hypothetical protein
MASLGLESRGFGLSPSLLLDWRTVAVAPVERRHVYQPDCSKNYNLAPVYRTICIERHRQQYIPHDCVLEVEETFGFLENSQRMIETRKHGSRKSRVLRVYAGVWWGALSLFLPTMIAIEMSRNCDNAAVLLDAIVVTLFPVFVGLYLLWRSRPRSRFRCLVRTIATVSLATIVSDCYNPIGILALNETFELVLFLPVLISFPVAELRWRAVKVEVRLQRLLEYLRTKHGNVGTNVGTDGTVLRS